VCELSQQFVFLISWVNVTVSCRVAYHDLQRYVHLSNFVPNVYEHFKKLHIQLHTKQCTDVWAIIEHL